MTNGETNIGLEIIPVNGPHSNMPKSKTNKLFVSRAGEKVCFALEHFSLSIEQKVCADFGSSTGGFVDCLLQKGAKKVYAVETGYGVLDWKLRNDTRVVVMERTNAMHVKLPEIVDFISIDVSWTSLIKILPNAILNLRSGGEIVALLKTHYEITAKNPKAQASKISKSDAEKIKNEVLADIKNLPVELKGVIESPLRGGKGGNIEYLVWMHKK